VPRWQRSERLSIFIQPKHETYLALLGLLTGTIAAHCQPARVYSDAGSIFIERAGGITKLTASEMDVDPVLSPSGAFVVYTRQGRGRSRRHYEPNQFCPTEPRPDELRRINLDGSDDRLLLKGRAGDPEHQLCDYKSKQFSSDSRRALFPHAGLGNIRRIARVRHARR
jgi:hypothetical protein